MTRQLENFFPLTDAKVSDVVSDVEAMDASVVFARKGPIVTLALGDELETNPAE